MSEGAPERVWVDELDKCHPDVNGECLCRFRPEVVYRRFLQMDKEVARLREALDGVQEWCVCEIPRLMWKPGQLYRYVVDETCPACREYAKEMEQTDE